MNDYKAYGKIEIGHKKLSERVEKTLEQLSSNPTASISRACGDPHQAKAVYRLLSSEKFTAESILEVSQKETISRITASGERIVLIPQDTTAINYSSLKKTEGLGTIGENHSTNLGIMLHSAIAVSEQGQPFGLLWGKAWTRPVEEHGKKHKRKQKPIEEKESNKWLEMIDKTNIMKELGDVRCIYLCDRENDIYEFFAKAAVESVTYICRRIQNRMIQNEAEAEIEMNKYLNDLEKAGETLIAVPRDSHTKREERTAKLEIKFGKALIKKPAYIKLSEKTPITVEVSLVSAIEVEPPDGAEAISWQLITNESVNSFDDALTCVNRYMQRWKIETFHYVLKSGCAIEKLQENTAAKLIKLIALYSIIALRIMALTYLARTAPNASCEIAFEDNEWKILYKVAKKTKSVPENPPTIFNAVIMLAKLGGFLARKSDGFPGVSVIWRGLIAFYSIFHASLYLT